MIEFFVLQLMHTVGFAVLVIEKGEPEQECTQTGFSRHSPNISGAPSACQTLY